MSSHEKIGKILADSIPRELLLHFERLYQAALEQALAIGLASHEGHRSSVVGHNRHFSLNEALMHALDECGIEHTVLRGNAVLVGKVGIAAIARVHMNHGKWDNSRRSKAKVKLCAPNQNVARLVQMDLLQSTEPEMATIAAFLVTQGDGTDRNPAEVYIVVPDETMDLRNPIFVESLGIFIQRYQQTLNVVDAAQPLLKPGIKRKKDLGES